MTRDMLLRAQQCPELVPVHKEQGFEIAAALYTARDHMSEQTVPRWCRLHGRCHARTQEISVLVAARARVQIAAAITGL